MRILVVLLLPIGDTLFATPALHALRERYPDARITALVYPTNHGILCSNPDINDFLFWPVIEQWPGLRGVVRLFWGMRRARFDLAAAFKSETWWDTWWVMRASAARKQVYMKLPTLWWLKPGAGREWRKEHAVEHYNDVVHQAGIKVEDLRLRIFPTAQDKARAQAWLDRYRVTPGELLVGIHLGGEGLWGRKRWGVKGFARVADGLSERVGARIIVMGGKDDARLAAELVAMSHADVINATGQTTLGETAALAARCALFIGNDSSPLHIAAASSTPVVGIYGITDPRSYHPWIPGGREGADYAVVRSYLPCACNFSLVGGITLVEWMRCLTCPALKTITPEQVLQAALGLLEARADPAKA